MILIQSYLSNLKQHIYYNVFYLNIGIATSGVPQGSNIETLLFLII